MSGFRRQKFSGWKGRVILLSLLPVVGAGDALEAQNTRLTATVSYLPANMISGDPPGTFQVNVYNVGTVPATNVYLLVDPDPNLAILSAFSSQGTVSNSSGGVVWLLPTLGTGSLGVATVDMVFQPCNVQGPSTIDYTTVASADNAPAVFASQEGLLNPPMVSAAFNSGVVQITTPLQPGGTLLQALNLTGAPWQTVANSSRVAVGNNYVYNLGASNGQAFFRWSAGSAPNPAATIIFQEAISTDGGPLLVPSGVGVLETEIIPGTDPNFINLVAGPPGPLNTNQWVIQNLPVSPAAGFPYSPLIFFQLPTNYPPGLSNFLNFTLTVTSNALSTPDLADTNLLRIYSYPVYYCGGVGSNAIVFNFTNQSTDWSFLTNWVRIAQADAQPGFPNIEQGTNECVPGALVNSLEYLNSYFQLNIAASNLTVAAMKQAVQWTNLGAPANWASLKAQYMASNNIPIVTEVTNNFTNALNAIGLTNDVEIAVVGHVACVVGMSQYQNGRYDITIQHDIRQGQPGGTVRQIISVDPATGAVTGLPWGPSQFVNFVIEHPPP